MIKLAKNPLRELTDDIVRTMAPIVRRRRPIERETINRILKEVFPEQHEPAKPKDVLLLLAEAQTKAALHDLTRLKPKSAKKTKGGSSAKPAKQKSRGLSKGPFKFDCTDGEERILARSRKVLLSQDYLDVLRKLLGVGLKPSERKDSCDVETVAGCYLKVRARRDNPSFNDKQLVAPVRRALSGGVDNEQLSKWAELHMSNFYRWLRGEGLNSKAVARFKKVKGATGRYVLGAGWPKDAKRFVNAPENQHTRAKDGVADGYAEQ